MSPPPPPGRHVLAAPRFYVTPAQRLSPGTVLLAVVIAFCCIPPVLYALSHSQKAGWLRAGGNGRPSGAPEAGANAGGGAGEDKDDDDPSQVDTIYLGGPREAPVPARPGAHPGAHPSTVHPFVVVQLPRSGDGVGQIPDSPVGRLLYDWLAAFNSKDPLASGGALPSQEAGVREAETELRLSTGGFTLVSAKEVQPGLLVFRLHDQTAAATEVLGTLEMEAGSSPPTIASFSLRAIPEAEGAVPQP